MEKKNEEKNPMKINTGASQGNSNVEFWRVVFFTLVIIGSAIVLLIGLFIWVFGNAK